MISISRLNKNNLLIIKIAAVFILFISFCYLRFYNLDKRIIFDWDQEHYAYEIKNIIQNHKFTLIGPRANNDKGFFLGPYFTYLMLPFYLITNLHPSGSIIFVILYNLIFFFFSFFLINKIFGFKQAFLFLFLWNINDLLIGYDATPWWPILIPLGVLITWYWLDRIERKNVFKDWFILGISLGFFLNMHFQFIFMVYYSLVYLAIFVISRKKMFWRNLAGLFIGFVLMFLPLFLFDLRHNFLNSKLFFNFFVQGTDKTPADLFAWFPVFTNFIKPVLPYKTQPLMFIFLLLILLFSFILAFVSKKNRIYFISFLILWITTPIFFSLYGKRPSEYYYVYLYPFIFIITGQIISRIKQGYLSRVITLILMIYIVIINWQPISSTLMNNRFGLSAKDKAIKVLKKYTLGKKLNVSFDTPLGANNGYQYLIEQNGIKQSGNWNDPLFQIRIPPKENDIVVDLIGIKLPDEYYKDYLK